MYYSPSYGAAGIGLIAIIAVLLLSFGGAVALSVIFLSRKRYEKSVGKPAMNWLFRFINFDTYLFSFIAKFTYLFLTLAMMCLAFVVMFNGEILTGLLFLIGAPIVIRLAYELVYILFGMRDQLDSINRSLLEMKKNGTAPAAPAAPIAPVAPAPAAPVAPAAPEAPFISPAPAAPQRVDAPAAPVAPQRPVAPAAPAAPQRPVAPAAPAAPQRPAATAPQQRPAQPAPQQAAARRYCPKCGREVKPGAPFCSNCGTRM